MPFSVKDMVAVEGMRLTFGSYMFEHNVADHDSVAVQRLKAAGGIPIGMTAMGEFGHKGFNDSPLWGVTRNPWKLDRTTGGSSGGAAAAIAAGMVAAFCLLSCVIWTGFGTVIGRFLAGPRARIAFNWSMAGLLVLSLIPVFW